jgi:hypothetical protein
MSDEKKEIILEGIALYANLPPRPAQKGFESEDTSYSVLIECTQAKYKALKTAGMPALTQLKDWPEDFKNKKDGKLPAELKSAEGKSFLRLKASKTKTKKDGTQTEFADIPVVDEYGDTITDSIANGSTLRIRAVLEPAAKGSTHKALRLKQVVVLDLIVYNDEKGEALPSSLGIKQKPVAEHSDEEDSESSDDDLFAR